MCYKIKLGTIVFNSVIRSNYVLICNLANERFILKKYIILSFPSFQHNQNDIYDTDSAFIVICMTYVST